MSNSNNAARGDAAGCGGQLDPLGPRVDPGHRAVLVESHAGVEARAAQSPGQLCGVDDRGAVVDLQSAVIRGRIHLSAHGGLVERVDAVVVRTHLVRCLEEFCVLPRCGRRIDHPGSLEVAVDLERVNRRLDGVEVLDTETIQGVELVAEPAQPVGKTVREARVAETAVATRCRIGGAPRLEHNDVERRVALPRKQCGPETGEAGTHNGEITLRIADEGWLRLRCVRVVEPEHGRSRIAKGQMSRLFGHGAHLPRAPASGTTRRPTRW